LLASSISAKQEKIASNYGFVKMAIPN